MRDTEMRTQLSQRIKETIQVFDKEQWFTVRPNVFAIQYLDGYILYSPLQGLIALITRAGLTSLLLNEFLPISECLSKCLFKKDLKTIKLFDTYPRQQPNVNSGKRSEFKPSALMLSPTSACQLACTYCYIRGGDKPRNMPWYIAEAAIRFTIRNALFKKVPTYSLNFHGQGEPTANWKLCSDAVIFTEKLCTDFKLKPIFSVVTNGILNNKKITFMGNHNFSILLSMDGLKKTMDLQRPLRSGGSSFEKVISTINCFEKKGIRYAIRSTVTKLNLEEMDDFVDFIKTNTKCKSIYFEPVFNSGRAKDSKLNDSKILSQFTQNFIEVKNRWIKDGIKIDFSVCKIDGIRTTYCGAYGMDPTFAVSTDGLVSSCYEVLDENDPRSDIFIYGKYDTGSNSFKYSKQRLESLLNLNVTQIEGCNDCYLKWNCGGGCLSKKAYNGFENIQSGENLDYCKTNYEVIKHNLFRSVIRDYDL